MKLLKLYKNTNIRKIRFLFILTLSLFVNVLSVVCQTYTVVLDAGHGGKDSGASNGKYIEKDIALNVVLQIGNELKKYKGIKVIYTRNKDVFVELHKRATIANKHNASLFVSVHCDSFKPNPKAHGASTYVLGLNGNATNLEIAKKENAVILLEDNYKSNYDYDPNSPESVIGLSVLQEENLDNSVRFASMIQTNFVSDLKRRNRSVKQANFLVLRETIMPSVLVELGFLSNSKEGKYLNTRRGQTELAKAISKGIRKYINHIKLNTVDVTKQVVTPKKTPVVKKTPVKKVVKTPKAKAKPAPVVVKKKEAKPTKVKIEQKKPKTTVVVVNKKPKEEKKVAVVKKPKEKVVVKKEAKKEEQKKAPEQKDKLEEKGIFFRVQLAASKKYIVAEPNNFKGLENVEMIYIDDYYKYFYGFSSDFQSIKKIRQSLLNKGHEGVFIVAFKDGAKIPLKEALKRP